jgi:ubiquinone/menaquinone biosynthesis C-methylase UbiE
VTTTPFESLARAEERRVLEVGSSAGLADRVARELGAQVVAVGAFEELPFPSCSFECVVAAPDLPDAALQEVRRVLDEEGQLVALAPQSQLSLLRYFTVVERRDDLFLCTP